MDVLPIALAQINPTVGALDENTDKVLLYAKQAQTASARVVIFPELTLSGYPPEDLLLKRSFINDCQVSLEQLVSTLPKELITIVGTPLLINEQLHNTAAIIANGKMCGIYSKMLLPNYSVFDEKRYFQQGEKPFILDVQHARLAIHICEDSWLPAEPPTALLQELEVDGLLNLSASPYQYKKQCLREEQLSCTAQASSSHLLYCNLVGGQDELVFDGSSMVLDKQGKLIARAKQFEEDLLLFPLPVQNTPKPKVSETTTYVNIPLEESSYPSSQPPSIEPAHAELEEIYGALKLGLHDYINKNGFKHVVVALSGGIDSALVITLAVDALGADRVTAITMPSQYTSGGTLTDANILADNLGVTLHTIPIKKLYTNYLEELASPFEGTEPDVTEENLQARIRGNLVMALSNKFGWIVLTTGNKSEMATGYCTIYGDMAGGFAVIKDVPKTMVFDLCRWRNEQGEIPTIPPSIITRPPSAELREDQKDSDSLPPYEVLDAILERYVEQDQSIQEIIEAGFSSNEATRVARLVDLNEYKRRQGPPGIKITSKAFGRDRRMPITNQYRERNES